MNKPIIWLIFIVVLLILVLVCHLLSKWIHKLTFGKHLLRSGRFINGHGLGLSDKSIFDEWNNDDYSLLLSDITEVPYFYACLTIEFLGPITGFVQLRHDVETIIGRRNSDGLLVYILYF